MLLNQEAFDATLSWYRDRKLVSEAEASQVLACFAPDYPFAEAMRQAETYHVHVKVADCRQLPHAAIAAFGGEAQNAKEGYVKYAHAGGLNMIFSSIPVAEDDQLEDAEPLATPRVDHVGIDLRAETPAVRAAFDAVPGQTSALGWAHAAQGGDRPVFCCHVEVGAKHWVYPGAAGPTMEFAYGPLKVNADAMGCDLRPIDPRHPRAAEVGCCGTPSVEECCAS